MSHLSQQPSEQAYSIEDCRISGGAGGNWGPFQQLKSDGWTDRPDKCHRFHMLPLKRLLFDAIFKASTTVTGQAQGCCWQSHCIEVDRWTMSNCLFGRLWRPYVGPSGMGRKQMPSFSQASIKEIAIWCNLQGKHHRNWTGAGLL